jgi:spermidine dehydrogenase
MNKIGKSLNELGASVDITRRDCLGGLLAGSGMALLSGLTPRELLAQTAVSGSAGTWTGLAPPDPAAAALFDGPSGIGDYRGNNGNTFDVMTRAHYIRDGVFGEAAFDSLPTDEDLDVVIVGGGAAGIGAAYQLKKERGDNLNVLVLENHNIFGGEAKSNEFEVDGHTVYGPQGSNLTMLPSSPTDQALGFDLLYDDYTDVGLPLRYEYEPLQGTEKDLDFDATGFMFMQQATVSDSMAYYGPPTAERPNPKPVRNPWVNGLEDLGYSRKIQQDMMKWHWGLLLDRPREGLEQWLDQMSYEDLLVNEYGLDPEVARFNDPLLASALGLGSRTCSAFSATIGLGFPGARLASETTLEAVADPEPRLLKGWCERNNFVSWPGGNSCVYRYFVKAIWPDAITGGNTDGEIQCNPIRFHRLDAPDNAFRMRLGATVVDVRHLKGGRVRIVYEKAGYLKAVTARSVVMATGNWVNRHIVRDAPSAMRTALASFVHAPVLVANVALHDWRFMERMSVTTAVYRDGDFGFSCNLRQPVRMTGYETPFHPDKPAVLTFYAPLYDSSLPAQEQVSTLRTEMFTTPFANYEKAIRQQMVRLFDDGGFDPGRDIAGLTLNRWGHAYVVPFPGYRHPFDGSKAPADVMRDGHDRVFFAHSELAGVQAFIGGFAEGKRAARQALERLA